jgi:glycerol-3-phosphate acyltransferase PlsY
MLSIAAIIVAYLVGAIPFAYVLAKAHGKDLRTIGSGNIGATNLSRALGRPWGYVCFGLDVLKGWVPMIVTLRFVKPVFLQSGGTEMQFLWLWLAIGCAAVTGHVLPVYLGFRGGKGVATSFGVALGLWPYYTLSAAIAAGVWVVVALTWRYVSLASMVAAACFPVILGGAMWLAPDWPISTLWPLLGVAVIIPIMVVFLHRANIRRLLDGTEARIRDKRPAAADLRPEGGLRGQAGTPVASARRRDSRGDIHD